MQMLKKIFNSDSKYYLELDETGESKPVQTAVKAAKKVAKQPVEKVAKTAEKAIDVLEEKLPPTPEKETQAKSKTTANKSKKNGSKVAVEGKKQPDKKAKPAPKNTGTSSYEPPFWVAAMYNKSTGGTNTNSNGSQAEQTFATDNLMPTITKYRRTPGPSLNKFRDIAKKAKTPRG